MSYLRNIQVEVDIALHEKSSLWFMICLVNMNNCQKQPPEMFDNKVFLKILQNSQEIHMPESFFNKDEGLSL